MKTNFNSLMYETKENNIDITIDKEHMNYFKYMADELYKQAFSILLQQYYNLMFFVLGIIILMIFFFTPRPYTFWMPATFLVGTQVIFFVAYMSLRFSFQGACKMIIETRKS